MPKAVRLGDICTGHDCFPPRKSTSGSPNVLINYKNAHRVGDSWEVHTCTHPDIPHGSHSGIMASGSPNVFVNNLPLARVGDNISCGSTASTGSHNVFVNGD